jgi:hypothetical protein
MMMLRGAGFVAAMRWSRSLSRVANARLGRVSNVQGLFSTSGQPNVIPTRVTFAPKLRKHFRLPLKRKMLPLPRQVRRRTIASRILARPP